MLNAVLNNQGTLDLTKTMTGVQIFKSKWEQSSFSQFMTEKLSNRQSIDTDKTALLGDISTFAKNLSYGIIIVLLTDSKNVPKSPNNKLKNILSNQMSSS